GGFVCTHASAEHGRQLYREMQDDLARQGRESDRFFITPSAYFGCAETRTGPADPTRDTEEWMMRGAQYSLSRAAREGREGLLRSGGHPLPNPPPLRGRRTP